MRVVDIKGLRSSMRVVGTNEVSFGRVAMANTPAVGLAICTDDVTPQQATVGVVRLPLGRSSDMLDRHLTVASGLEDTTPPRRIGHNRTTTVPLPGADETPQNSGAGPLWPVSVIVIVIVPVPSIPMNDGEVVRLVPKESSVVIKATSRHVVGRIRPGHPTPRSVVVLQNAAIGAVHLARETVSMGGNGQQRLVVGAPLLDKPVPVIPDVSLAHPSVAVHLNESVARVVDVA